MFNDIKCAPCFVSIDRLIQEVEILFMAPLMEELQRDLVLFLIK